MTKVIEAVYEDGVFKPLEKVELKDGERVRIRIEELESIIEETFGLLKGKDTMKALMHVEDEWGFC